jgi:hypothetical protein
MAKIQQIGRVAHALRFLAPFTKKWVPHSFAEANFWFLSFGERVGSTVHACSAARVPFGR